MWANLLCVHVAVNVINDGADISLELTTTRASRRATPLLDWCNPLKPSHGRKLLE